MRKAGVLMPVSALPSRVGAGELGEAAFHFIELLKKNHVKIWQILPLNPVGYGNFRYLLSSMHGIRHIHTPIPVLQILYMQTLPVPFSL